MTNTTYRADGVKVKKLFGDIETDYLDGFQYKAMYEHEVGIVVGGGDIISLPEPNKAPELKLRIITTAEGYYDATRKNYSVSQTIDSVDATIGGTRFGTVTTYINKSVTKPMIKSNGEPHKRKTTTSVVKVPVSTAKDIRLR